MIGAIVLWVIGLALIICGLGYAFVSYTAEGYGYPTGPFGSRGLGVFLGLLCAVAGAVLILVN